MYIDQTLEIMEGPQPKELDYAKGGTVVSTVASQEEVSGF